MSSLVHLFFSSLMHKIVTLHQAESASGCPGDTITLQCSVHSNALQWQCADGTYRVVQCSSANIRQLECQNHEFNVTLHDCDTDSSGTIITSLAKFILTNYTTTLTCGDALSMSINETTTLPKQRKYPHCMLCDLYVLVLKYI